MSSEVREDFADDAAEFESVTGKSGSDRHLRMGGMAFDDKVEVGRAGVEAGGGVHQRTVQSRQEPAKNGPHLLLIRRV